MFRSIISAIPRDKDFPARTFTLQVNERVLEGALYDHIPSAFHQEKNDAGEYIPLRNRRPAVRYNLCRLVVDDSVSLLFSEGHFPTPDGDGDLKEAAAALIKATKLNEVMLEAATAGSVGSVAIQLRVLKQDDDTYRAFYAVHSTHFLTPTFKANAPDVLERITERYKVKGAVLKASGYEIPPDDIGADFWFQRQWNDQAETWFMPWPVADEAAEPVEDADNSVDHGLGFVPWVWVRNLPGRLKLHETSLAYSDLDGACTFDAAIESMIEIEYQLSQAGRGLKYSMDPTLLIKEPAAPSGEMVKSPASALVVDKDGDAKLLEIGGEAFSVVLDYVKSVREYALESTHGNRAEASKLSAAQSGRAMELMNQALIWLADRLRVSYGEGALLSLLKMALLAHKKFPLSIDGEALPEVDPKGLSLRWPAWHAPTSHDLQEQATTITTLTDGGILSRETAVKTVAANYDVEDVPAELTKIQADIEAASAVIEAQGGQPKPQEAAPV